MVYRSAVRSGLFVLVAVLAFGLLAGCSSCGDPCDPVNACTAPDPCDPCAGRPEGIPDDAQPGQAWCRYYIPPTYEEEEYEVCVCPESCKKTWVPPVYEDQERQVCCKPACSRCVQVPGEYNDVTETVECCPARTEWRKVDCTPKMLEEGQRQGDCWMLIEIPAVTKEVTKRVCTKEPTTRTETTEPEYKTVIDKVMVKPGFYETDTIPAKYETRSRKKCTGPGSWEWRRNEDCDVPTPAAEASEGG